MNARKITIVDTKSQRKVSLMSGAETLGQLKIDLNQYNIDYAGAVFFEGLTKTRLEDDSSLLPVNVQYKGTTTNELVFMITAAEKKTKSGTLSRNEIYQIIKEKGLQNQCKKKFGKNFTMCKTEELLKLIKDFSTPTKKEEIESKEEDNKNNENQEIDKRISNLTYVVNQILEILYSEDIIIEETYEELKEKIEKDYSTEGESSYSNKEIGDMFAFIK